MARKQLTVASQKAWDLAHRLAQDENRTVAEIVERALETYEAWREPAAVFYRRLSEQCGTDVELEQTIRLARKPYTGLDL